MKSFRDPKYVKRYEDVIFDLKTPLNTTVANNANRKKDGYRFVVDNSGEVAPFDWYNARISLDFKVNLLANGGNIALADHDFNSEGQSSYMSQYLKTHKWTYLRENIERSNSSRQRARHFGISTGISKPRHVFVFIINDANIDAQTANPFFYNTFSISTDQRTLSNCHLEVGNGNEYPEIHYTPTTDMTRVYRDVLKCFHKGNEYGEGSLLNRANFSTLFPFYILISQNKIWTLRTALQN